MSKVAATIGTDQYVTQIRRVVHGASFRVIGNTGYLLRYLLRSATGVWFWWRTRETRRICDKLVAGSIHAMDPGSWPSNRSTTRNVRDAVAERRRDSSGNWGSRRVRDNSKRRQSIFQLAVV